MKLTKKNGWLIPEKICIVRGNSVANNLMFESKNNHKLFFKLWDKYLGGMTEVLHYHLAADTWTILFKTKTEPQIIQAYRNQRMKSRKAKQKYTLKEPKRMLSEHMRIFLSQYVRKVNARLGRRGSLVMERFRKYIVSSQLDYKRVFDLITKNPQEISQKIKKYQYDQRRYDMKNEMGKDSIWKVGIRYYKGELGLERVLGSMRLVSPDSPVLRNFFESTATRYPNLENP